MAVKLLTEQHLEFLSLKGGCTGSSESTLVKMAHCWKTHVMAHAFFFKKIIFLICVSFSSCIERRKLLSFFRQPVNMHVNEP